MKKRSENGLTLVECIIALIIIMVAVLGLFDLMVISVRNGEFIQRLADVQALSYGKATEVANDVNKVVATIPQGQTKIGSVAPSDPVVGFYDTLDRAGNVIETEGVAKFTRQWMVVKDHPLQGEITVYCSVTYLDKHYITRLARVVKTK
jgi:hypothetical protein